MTTFLKSITFLLILSFADYAFAYITQNAPNGCLGPAQISAVAVFTPNVHTCVNGYYLPPNVDVCSPCPTGQTCVGGTYLFNPNISHGVQYTAPINANIINGCSSDFYGLKAKFIPNVHTCTPGYYMPANNDGCVICPVDNYCSGGTYTFSETVTQGITPCPAGTVAPSGMWELEQCGRTLHIGTNTLYLRTTKKTTPALNFDFDGDGVADLFANTTTSDRIMNRDSLQKLKIKVGDTVYSVYDDTMEQ